MDKRKYKYKLIYYFKRNMTQKKYEYMNYQVYQKPCKIAVQLGLNCKNKKIITNNSIFTLPPLVPNPNSY